MLSIQTPTFYHFKIDHMLSIRIRKFLCHNKSMYIYSTLSLVTLISLSFIFFRFEFFELPQIKFENDKYRVDKA